MKLKFDANLEYQEQAISSVVDLFRGQTPMQSNFTVSAYAKQVGIFDTENGIGNRLELDSDEILENIQEIQLRNGLAQTKALKNKQYDFDVEMETGERVIIVTGCINALRSRVSGTLVNMIHALLRVIKYNYCKQCMRSKDVLALQY